MQEPTLDDRLSLIARDTTFPSVSQRNIDLQNPSPDMFTIYDIAAGLSKICRFAGQIQYFYSVAQHSVIVSRLAPPELKMVALLHDAAEAYLGDVVKPLKNLLGQAYTDIEESFERAIFERFDLDFNDIAKVKRYDLEAYDAEHDYMRKGRSMAWHTLHQKVNMTMEQYRLWLPAQAEAGFISEYNNLFHNGQSSTR